MSGVYDTAALRPLLPQFMALTAAYKAEYAVADPLLRAAQIFRTCALPRLMPETARALRAEARGIVEQAGIPGPVTEIFLSAVTGRGYISALPDAVLPAQKFIHVQGGSAAQALLAQLAAYARASGVRAVICRAPQDPQRVEHVIFPGVCAYISGAYANARVTLCAETLDADACGPAAPAHPAQADYNAQAEQAEKAAYTRLAAAKALHDELEALYHPHIDFNTADRLLQTHLAGLEARAS